MFQINVAVFVQEKGLITSQTIHGNYSITIRDILHKIGGFCRTSFPIIEEYINHDWGRSRLGYPSMDILQCRCTEDYLIQPILDINNLMNNFHIENQHNYIWLTDKFNKHDTSQTKLLLFIFNLFGTNIKNEPLYNYLELDNDQVSWTKDNTKYLMPTQYINLYQWKFQFGKRIMVNAAHIYLIDTTGQICQWCNGKFQKIYKFDHDILLHHDKYCKIQDILLHHDILYIAIRSPPNQLLYKNIKTDEELKHIYIPFKGTIQLTAVNQNTIFVYCNTHGRRHNADIYTFNQKTNELNKCLSIKKLIIMNPTNNRCKRVSNINIINNQMYSVYIETGEIMQYNTETQQWETRFKLIEQQWETRLKRDITISNVTLDGKYIIIHEVCNDRYGKYTSNKLFILNVVTMEIKESALPGPCSYVAIDMVIIDKQMEVLNDGWFRMMKLQFGSLLKNFPLCLKKLTSQYNVQETVYFIDCKRKRYLYTNINNVFESFK